MSIEKYLVKTTMGNSLLKPSDSVYVKIGNNDFLKKSVYDLNSGESIIFTKPFARTSLEDVEPLLCKSPRYAKADEVIHETNSRGDKIPKLRVMLLRGLAPMAGINSELLEDKIMKQDGCDFTAEEYNVMASYLHNTMQNANYNITEWGVMNWIKGDVRAPRKWQAFDVLKTINPEFEQFRIYDDNPKSMYFNYRVYVTIRQGIMRFLNKCKGTNTGQDTSEYTSDGKIHISPEYQIVLNHFMGDLSENYATARVTSVSRLDKPRQIIHVQENDKLLCDGILTQGQDFPDLQTTNYEEVATLSYIIDNYFSSALQSFPLEIDFNGRKIPFIPNRRALIPYINYSSAKFMEKYGEGIDNLTRVEMKNIERNKDNWRAVNDNEKINLKDTLNLVALKHIESVLNGDLDLFLGYDRGTFMRLMESAFKTRKAVQDYFDYQALENENYYQMNLLQFTDRKERREMEHKMNKFQRKLRNKGIRITNEGIVIFREAFFTDSLGIYLDNYDSDLPNLRPPIIDKVLKKYGKDKIPLSGIVIEHNQKNKEFIRLLLKSLEDNGIAPLSRQRVLESLKKFGLENITDLRWHDFVWEDL